MTRVASTSFLHLYQIAAIYFPGAAVIPVTVMLGLLKPLWAAGFFACCLARVILGLSYRSRVAVASGLPEDFE